MGRVDPSLPPYYYRLWTAEEAFKHAIPILTYHQVDNPKKRTLYPFLYLSPRLFKIQIGELAKNNFHTSSLSFAKEEQTFNPSRIILTFDDGYESVFRNALPILNQNGFKAILFLVPNYIGRTNGWDNHSKIAQEALMDDIQIREWINSGHEIGAHSMNHPRLTHIGISEAREEIFSSKKFLEDKFGVPIEHFCYPYGDHNAQIRGITEDAGFRTACGTKIGLNNRKEISSLELKRFTARYASRRSSHLIRHGLQRLKYWCQKLR
jgi:peptidoglycan/xylan/chitin deacetylase (PgdA/CDA1 family)